MGYHIRIAESVYWPLRIGAGFVMAGDRTDFQGRVDLFNVSVKTKYVLLDASFASVRYVSDFNAYHRWTGLLAVGASYISP
jgi:hypothetical protein